jgi:hypothetical protein
VFSGTSTQRHPSRKRWRPGKLILGLAALAMLAMPADYRGGAEVAHAHAVFQFWTASGRAAADHHHSHDSGRASVHGHAIVGDSWLAQTEPIQPDATSDQRVVLPPPDAPVLTNLVHTAEHNGLLALALAGIAAIYFGVPAPISTRTPMLAPFFPPPTTPPPR